MGHLYAVILAPIILLLPPLLHSLQSLRLTATRCFSGPERQVGYDERNTTSVC